MEFARYQYHEEHWYIMTKEIGNNVKRIDVEASMCSVV